MTARIRVGTQTAHQHMVQASPHLIFGMAFDGSTTSQKSADQLARAAFGAQLALRSLLEHEEDFPPYVLRAAVEGATVLLSLSLAMTDDLHREKAEAQPM